MSDNILNDIENGIYEFDKNGHTDVVIKFSPEGHARARAEKMASCFFSTHISDEAPSPRFAGYPYEVVPGQVETFKIELTDGT